MRRFAAVVTPWVVTGLVLVGCRSTPENRDPTGETFPSVRGESLDGRDYRIPEDFEGDPAVLLVGYVMNAQFDIDRWLLGLMQSELPVRVVEVPTVEGMIPGLFAGSIDKGMRSGIPEEDWASVVTVYGDAKRIVRLTGRERARNARVLLLDADGQVVWFHDEGYSPRELLELRDVLEKLE